MALFIEVAFGLVGLDWREYVVSDTGLCRPTDIAVSRGNPAKAILVPRGYANERLGWVAKHKIADTIDLSPGYKIYLNLCRST
jgi:GDPmannose 4,6-dehydratase